MACDRPPDLRNRRDLDEAIVNPGRCRNLVAWVMDSGRLGEYALAKNLGANSAAAGSDRSNNNSNNDEGDDSNSDGDSDSSRNRGQ
jgi:hypothetical protein